MDDKIAGLHREAAEAVIVRRLSRLEDIAVDLQCATYHLAPNEPGCPRGHCGHSGMSGDAELDFGGLAMHYIQAIESTLAEAMRDLMRISERGTRSVGRAELEARLRTANAEVDRLTERCTALERELKTRRDCQTCWSDEQGIEPGHCETCSSKNPMWMLAARFGGEA